MSRLQVMTVFGTRPEAIKMAPVIQALAAEPHQFEPIVCVTAQHREMLDQVLNLFEISPNVDLDLMRPNQDLVELTSRVLLGIKEVIASYQPDIVLVHGDTTTTLAASLASFYAKIPVGHVEAGLRTFDKYYPFPEEINRVVTDNIATLFFAPTERSRQNLLQIGAPADAITVTGNTVIDALLYTLNKTGDTPLPVNLDPHRRMILVTVHRRENFGEPLLEICEALKTLIVENPDTEIVLPVHLNPNVRQTVFEKLSGLERVHLIEPLDYAPFCQLIKHAYLVLTDSGGIQEEAPSICKPVLVLRDETERPEAVEMGTVKLVGPHKDKILEEAQRLLDNPAAYAQVAQAVNPYGDGLAAQRIISVLKAFRAIPSVC
jgi:UDP-N-acetylglucosamine 2-epimerase (non-hydrolysing)